MILKEFRQMRRDRRTVALMVGLPLMMLIIFGYAARFDVVEIETAVLGPGADIAAGQLDDAFTVVEQDPAGTAEDARQLLADSRAAVAIVTGAEPTIYVDGTELFVAQSALRRGDSLPAGVEGEILFNPDLSTAAVMVPSLIGLILLFIGTVITSLGVVREREQGTLEQLAVTPLRPSDVIVGKIAPYFVVALIDMVIITLAGILIFDVPFRGSLFLFAVFGLVYLFVVLGLGVLISTVSRSQGEAIQLAIMVLLPQVMLSGMIFPLKSMAEGVRWIGYLLPLTYFVEAMRGIFLKASSFGALVQPLVILVLMAVAVFGLAVWRFRRDVAPRAAATS
ncbi:MAG: ABC transporter permease [Acidimicrobiia bacterium]|nr:ABC transporter permease [Acidimicrobiia bacterium]NNL68400.1 ABC transporter permease [Acidimicrobiia bacterium]